MKPRSPFLLAVMVGGTLSCLGASAYPGEANFPTDKEVHTILRQRIDEEQLGVGIVVGLIDGSGTTRFVSHGTIAPGGPAVDEHSLFEIGSITKTFTATLLAMATERGTMKLDDPAAKFLPPEWQVPTRSGRQITLLDLATQRSGLPRLPDNFAPADPANPYADYTEAQLAEFLSGHALRRNPGAEYEYSNLGFGLLGQALARAAKTDYATLVQREICEPLKLTETTTAPTAEQSARLAKPFDESLEPTRNWDNPTLAGAGSLYSDAADLLRYAAANLGLVEFSGAKAMKDAHQPRASVSGDTRIGLAWMTTNYHGQTVVWHNGTTGGYHAYVGLDPIGKRGVVVLSNSPNNVDDVGVHLLDPASPLTTPTAPPFALPSAAEDPYVGSYKLNPDFAIQITRRGSRYFLQATGQGKDQLFPKTPELFFLRVVDAQIGFEDKQNGKYGALVLHQGGHDQKGPRMAASEPLPTPRVIKARAAIKIKPEIGALYVGRYELAPGFIFDVTQQGDRYYAQLTGQGKLEIFPEADADFFYKVVDAQITFVRDASGKSTALVLHQGGDHPAKRLP